MKLDALAAPSARLDRALGVPAEGVKPEGRPALDTEAAWRAGLAGQRRGGGPVKGAGQARGLGPQAAIFGPGLEAKKTTAKQLYADVARALSALEPDAGAAELRATLGKLGARYVETDEGWVRFSRGKAEIALRPFSIGGLPAAELAITAPGKKKKAKTKRGVFFQGTVFRPKHWDAFQTRYSEEIGRFVRAVKAEPEELPEDFDGLKAFLQRGMSKAEREKKAARATALAARSAEIAAQLEAMKADGTAPKGAIVYVAGPDAAGKSSTGGIVMQALEQAGYALDTAVFKAPTEEERAQHWLKRFERGIPEAGQAIFWDRGPAGDSVYGPADDAQAARMGREMTAFEADLRKQGILLVKVELSAGQQKQAATFGKRLARQHIAAKLEATLAARGELDGAAEAGIAEIQGKLDGADFEAFERFEDIQGRFMRFVEASSSEAPWLVIDATKRHAARLELLDGLSKTLEDFAARAKD